MKNARRQEGFTLIELLVTILCGTIVFAAAVTILLLGLRMNAKNTATARQQNEVRIVFSMLEEMVAEGTANTLGETETGWKLSDGTADGVSIEYSEQADAAENETVGVLMNGTSTLIDEIKVATCTFENRLLTISITTADGTIYRTVIYCRLDFTDNTRAEETPEQASRTASPTPYVAETEFAAPDPRAEFLSILSAEIGSTGKITGTEIYYSQWYTAQQNHLSWPEDTPWCACFLSWAAAQVEDDLNSVPYFAHVNDGIWGFSGLNVGNGSDWSGVWYNAEEYLPVPGDFIFFNLDDDSDADHVGAVFSVTGDTVFTIEGNCDGKVTICSYCLADPSILGYGILDWKSN